MLCKHITYSKLLAKLYLTGKFRKKTQYNIIYCLYWNYLCIKQTVLLFNTISTKQLFRPQLVLEKHFQLPHLSHRKGEL